VLRLNFDETSIRQFQATGPGALVWAAVRRQRTRRPLSHSATKQDARTAFTFLTTICDDVAVQSCLPQVILVKSYYLSAAQLVRVRALLPATYKLWIEKKAWMNTTLMERYVETLATALEPYRGERAVILCGDAYKAHCGPRVWRAMARHRFFYFLIPAGLTGVLQPCDTHVFARFKHRLGVFSQWLSSQVTGGRVEADGLIDALVQTAVEVLAQHCWHTAFASSGLTGTQSAVSLRVLESLGLERIPVISADVPTLAQLRRVFPRRTSIPIYAVFACFLQPSGRRQAEGQSASSTQATLPTGRGNPIPQPWQARLRRTPARIASERESQRGGDREVGRG